jgi:hypothetical protein
MKIKLGFKAMLFATLAFGAALAPACGPSTARFCSKVCECSSGCNDDARAQCIESVSDSRKTASEKGCDAEFDTYFACANAEVSCSGSSTKITGCETEQDELFACAGPLAVGGNVCEVAIQQINSKSEECGFGSNPTEGPIDCPPEQGVQSLCVAKCFSAATCAALDGTDQEATNDYVECLEGCS